jgi:hypothetical protein
MSYEPRPDGRTFLGCDMPELAMLAGGLLLVGRRGRGHLGRPYRVREVRTTERRNRPTKCCRSGRGRRRCNFLISMAKWGAGHPHKWVP